MSLMGNNADYEMAMENINDQIAKAVDSLDQITHYIHEKVALTTRQEEEIEDMFSEVYSILRNI